MTVDNTKTKQAYRTVHRDLNELMNRRQHDHHINTLVRIIDPHALTSELSSEEVWDLRSALSALAAMKRTYEGNYRG